MRIGFVSYEYAGVAGGGGIGTYVRNAAQMLFERGHDVSVFTSCDAKVQGSTNGPAVHVTAATREVFSAAVFPVFSEQHALKPFDVIESAEYGADGDAIGSSHESIARVVKLHTPKFVVDEIVRSYVPRFSRLRFVLGALRRGRLPKHWAYDPINDREYAHALAADVITFPSIAMAQRVEAAWDFGNIELLHVPNVFIPSNELLQIAPGTNTQRVLFVGRLETRKGVIELAKAIPSVLRVVPSAKFRFVGRSCPHPNGREDLASFIRRLVGAGNDAVEFIDGVPYSEIPKLLSDADICVFPSVWENFPYVCLEAMAAARGIVASRAGGMSEMLNTGRAGLLTPPCDSAALANAILHLLANPTRRVEMGVSARERVLQTYTPTQIARSQEESYERAICIARKRVKAGVK